MTADPDENEAHPRRGSCPTAIDGCCLLTGEFIIAGGAAGVHFGGHFGIVGNIIGALIGGLLGLLVSLVLRWIASWIARLWRRWRRSRLMR